VRAAIYLRVSTEEQALHGYSLADQREACRERARALGAKEILEFADEGHSGATLERPGLMALREAVHQGRVDCVVIRDPDRLSRRLAHQLLLTEEFERAGVRLEFIDFTWQDTPEGRLFYSIRGAIAEYEREKIRDRMTRGKIQKAKQGGIPHRFHVYGYDYDPATGKISVNEAEAVVVRQIFTWFTEEDIGANGVAARLNEMGVPSKTGRAWHRRVVRGILSNPTYTGTWLFNRRDCRGGKQARKGEDYPLKPQEEWIPIAVPAIIEHELFERAQAKLVDVRRLYAGRPRRKYLLSGLVTCANCGRPMHNETGNVWGTRVRIYTCKVKTSGIRRGCGRQVRADRLEEEVWRVVTSYLNDPDAVVREMEAMRGDGALEGELEQIEKAIARVEKGRAALLDALSSGVLDLDADTKARLADLKRQRDKLLGRKKELESAMAESKSALMKANDLRQLAESVLGRLDLLSEDERREIVRALVRRVIVQKDEKGTSFTLHLNIPAAVTVVMDACGGLVT